MPTEQKGANWVDRRGPLGSRQAFDWYNQHGRKLPNPIRQIKAVLRAIVDRPVQINSVECGEDGAPKLKDEMVTRADVLCAVSRLPEVEQRLGIEFVYVNGMSYRDAARLLRVSESTLRRQIAAAWPLLQQMLFDYEAD